MPYRARLATALVAVLGVLAAPASGAVTCRLVTDPAGDQALVLPGTTAVAPSDLDILSADVAVGRKHVVVAIRLASLKPYEPLAPTRQYSVRFVIDDIDHWYFSAWVGAIPSSYAYGPRGTTITPTVAVDLAAREIRIAASNTILGKSWKGLPFHDVTVEASSYAGYPGYTRQIGPLHSSSAGYGTGVDLDVASTTRVYRGGAPTCVRMPG